MGVRHSCLKIEENSLGSDVLPTTADEESDWNQLAIIQKCDPIPRHASLRRVNMPQYETKCAEEEKIPDPLDSTVFEDQQKIVILYDGWEHIPDDIVQVIQDFLPTCQKSMLDCPQGALVCGGNCGTWICEESGERLIPHLLAYPDELKTFLNPEEESECSKCEARFCKNCIERMDSCNLCERKRCALCLRECHKEGVKTCTDCNNISCYGCKKAVCLDCRVEDQCCDKSMCVTCSSMASLTAPKDSQCTKCGFYPCEDCRNACLACKTVCKKCCNGQYVCDASVCLYIWEWTLKPTLGLQDERTEIGKENAKKLSDKDFLVSDVGGGECGSGITIEPKMNEIRLL